MEKLSMTDQRRLEARAKVAMFYNVQSADIQHLYITDLYKYIRAARRFLDLRDELLKNIAEYKELLKGSGK